ncbi:MAG TPA: rhodanese-like domain-containing protein [Azospirillaceae bacterium]|nr:rhodanese-like domain-containing protein [Azospirillaceae bacterium]HRQ80259.1 rhodanese-like domain-containing protein [Azospirillaceae bacterium]
MSDELLTILLIVAAFAALAWPRLRARLGMGRGLPAGEIKARLESGGDVVVLDVRNENEVAAGSLPGAVNIPLPALPSRIGELIEVMSGRPDAGIVLVCQSGPRAERAATILMAAGLRKLAVLKGGVTAWRNAGYALEYVTQKK